MFGNLGVAESVAWLSPRAARAFFWSLSLSVFCKSCVYAYVFIHIFYYVRHYFAQLARSLKNGMTSLEVPKGRDQSRKFKTGRFDLRRAIPESSGLLAPLRVPILKPPAKPGAPYYQFQKTWQNVHPLHKMHIK
jgi:hypothetical protein